MKIFLRSVAGGMFFLLLWMSVANAQEVTFSSGPAFTPASGAANGGFCWGDVNGDGTLDLFVPSNNIILNSITTFAQAASTMTANISLNPNGVGGLLADVNGDGVLDLFTTNGGTPAAGLFYNIGGVLTLATGTGDLATAGITGEVFQGSAVADIDHSNYLSLAWPGTFTGIAGNGAVPGGGAMWLLKGGASGFTNLARGATGANLSIDTSLSFESWDVRFFDANNDGYQDLLMPSFRCGFARIDTGSSGARKGCVLFLNNGAGKFIVPTAATVGRTLYSVGAGGVVSTTADTGIIVQDTVRHFTAIGEQWGDLNNDGIQDLVLNGLGASDNLTGNGTYVADVILYGKGDGTFTYTWNGVNVVANNGLVQATNQRAIGIGDYNNDGLADIYTSGTFAAQHMYRNNGDGTFTDVAVLDALTAGGQRAGQLVDYNNDGFLDVYMYTGGNSILQKNNTNSNKWIGFKPIGTGHNMSAIGARFTIYTGATKQIRDIKAEGGSAGQGGELRANFGLGAATKVDSLNVRWPDGTNHTWILGAANNTLAVNTYYTIQEGSVIPSSPLTTRPSWAAGDTSLASTDTLKWNAATSGTGTTNYTVQIATNSSFANIVKTVSAVSGLNTIVRLGLSTKYYWRVQAFDNGLSGAYSAIDSFRTQIVACNTTPTKLKPANNLKTVPSKNATLVVSYVSTASTYHFQVRPDSATGFNNASGFTLNDSTSDFDTSWVISATLTQAKTYYWRVRGYNPAGSSAWSGVDSFTIMFQPATPVLAFPTSNQADARADTLVFKWRRVAGDSNYVCQFWTYTAAGQYLISDTTKRDSSVRVTGLNNRARYYWKVMAFNQGGASAFTALDSFTTVIELPGAPSPTYPKNTLTENRRTKFGWAPNVNTLSYHLQVSTSSTFATIASDHVVQDTTYVLPDTLAANTLYYWRLSARNLGGEGPFSGVSHYTTSGLVLVNGFETVIPKEFALLQNYPNPFNPATTIRYDVPKSAYVTLVVYDVLGRVVATLVDGVQSANQYSVEFNASRLASGMYIYRIHARNQDGSGEFNAVKKLLLLK